MKLKIRLKCKCEDRSLSHNLWKNVCLDCNKRRYGLNHFLSAGEETKYINYEIKNINGL